MTIAAFLLSLINSFVIFYDRRIQVKVTATRQCLVDTASGGMDDALSVKVVNLGKAKIEIANLWFFFSEDAQFFITPRTFLLGALPVIIEPGCSYTFVLDWSSESIKLVRDNAPNPLIVKVSLPVGKVFCSPPVSFDEAPDVSEKDLLLNPSV